jgi:hypothetical protein
VDFKLIFFQFKKKCFDLEMTNHTFEILIFLVFSILQNYKVLKNRTKIPCFVNGENYKIDRKYSY